MIMESPSERDHSTSGVRPGAHAPRPRDPLRPGWGRRDPRDAAHAAAADDEALDWYEAEPPVRKLWVQDLQRLKRRAKTRLLLILAITFVVTAGMARKLSKRGASYDATVFMALDESALSSGRNSVPGREILQYVSTVLIPDKALADLAERRNLHRLRKKLGPEYAISELRMQFEIDVSQNDYAQRRIPGQARTAQIAIIAYGTSPEEAEMLANDIAEIAVKTADARNAEDAKLLANEIKRTIDELRSSAREREWEMNKARTALAGARLREDRVAIAKESVHYEAAERDWRRANTAFEEMNRRGASEASAEELQKAGLGIKARITDRVNPGALVDLRTGMAIALVFVFFGTLVSVSLLVAAFDSRIHDAEDISRLGLPVLGQVPDFPGQTSGSMQQRGFRRHHVPSFLRWRRS